MLASAFGFGPEIFELLENDPQAFDAEVLKMMATSDFLNWGFVDSMWHHGVDTPSGLMNEIKRFDIEDLIGQITSSVLVVDAEDETRAQALELYEGLTGAERAEYLKFTREEAAQFHDQPGANGIQTSRIFNWLDEVLESKHNNGGNGGKDKIESKSNVNSAATSISLVGGAAVMTILSAMFAIA